MYWGPRAPQGPDLFLIVKGYAYCVRGDYLFITNRVFEDLWLISGSPPPQWDPVMQGSWSEARISNHRREHHGYRAHHPWIDGGRIPEDMDGKCLVELLTEEKRKEISIQYTSSDEETSRETPMSKEEEELLRKQLKGLGYLA